VLLEGGGRCYKRQLRGSYPFIYERTVPISVGR